jgi:phosphatidylinositol alpha-1,6-mannosyltransferase
MNLKTPHKSIRFWLLSAFSMQGGIERFNRAMLHATYLLEQKNICNVSAEILHDYHLKENPYIPSTHLKTWKGNKIYFLFFSLLHLFKRETWVLGHLNLAPIGYLRKLVSPSKRLIVVCHGVEVFQPLKGIKKKILQQADLILAVSFHTKSELILKQGVAPEKIILFPNTLDPFFKLPINFNKPDYLKKRYQIKEQEKVLLTISRLNSKEGYKGYDQVFNTIPYLLKSGLNVKYILCGKADTSEENRIRNLIIELGIESHVVLTGFIQENELTDHYILSDVFVMPSKGEGFGIVYLEAMACGREVIAGNKDGSTEALQFGKLGTLIDPDNLDELNNSIVKVLTDPRDPVLIEKQMLEYFSFQQFQKRTSALVDIIYN